MDAAIDDTERGEHNSGSRYIKVTGVTASERYKEALDGQEASGDVKVAGQITKATLRADIQKKVFDLVRYLDDVSPSFSGEQVNEIYNATFTSSTSGTKLL